jgi:hypothetical protein
VEFALKDEPLPEDETFMLEDTLEILNKYFASHTKG